MSVTISSAPGVSTGNANTWTGQQTFSTSSPIFSTMTAGSILLAGTAGLLSQDNANLFWDRTNHRLGLGTNSPSADFVLNLHNNGGSAQFNIDADSPTSQGNGNFGFQYMSNSQIFFGFFNAGTYINFKGGGAQAVMTGAWTFPGGAAYPPDVLLCSLGNSFDDVRWRITKDHDLPGATILATTELYADNSQQPAMWFQADSFKFIIRVNNNWNQNVFAGFGLESMGMASNGTWRFLSCGPTVLPMYVRADPSQSANLQEWQTSGGTALSAVNSSGQHVQATKAGTPTGTPANGTMVYDTTNNLLYVYNGAWKSVLLT